MNSMNHKVHIYFNDLCDQNDDSETFDIGFFIYNFKGRTFVLTDKKLQKRIICNIFKDITDVFRTQSSIEDGTL